MLSTKEEKLEIVLRHLRDGITLRELAEEYEMHPSSIKYYVNLYLDHGPDVFTNEDGPKTYSREYKLAAIKRCIFHTREILAYDLSERPSFIQIKRMLDRLVCAHGEHLNGAILHSDQGWQYQMLYYQKFLLEHGMTQSMSRKGNCLDNSPTENFFGRMKTEMYYDKEFSFKSLNHLKKGIHEYILYYNNDRIVSRLKTSPAACRHSFNESSL